VERTLDDILVLADKVKELPPEPVERRRQTALELTLGAHRGRQSTRTPVRPRNWPCWASCPTIR
jgi:hypothetical protein